ncbi:MAG: alpha/beta fold hydrolase [Bacteroidetes bacterium]|nr:alpha/beta fold hydrolase [Bacteroidota bacterium]
MRKTVTIVSMLFSFFVVQLFSAQVSCHCYGNGPYTMVFDAGMGNWSVFFKPLAEKLKTKVKVCLFDRYNYKSRKLPKYRDLKTMAAEFNSELERNNITDSIILVGHSLGGLYVRMFHDLYPQKVSGMILLDAANPNLLDSIPALRENITKQTKQINKVINLANWGLLRLGKKNIPTFGLPENCLSEYYKVTTRKPYYLIYRLELASFDKILLESKSLGKIVDKPLLVIASNVGLNPPINSDSSTASKYSNTWVNLQKDLLTISTRSIYSETNADHFFHVSNPDFVSLQVSNYLFQMFGFK